MSERQPKPLTILLLGAGIGLIAGFLGIGGGVLIIPLLVFGFGLDARRATGTSLGVVSFVVAATVAMELLFGDASQPPAWIAALLILPTSLFAASHVAGFVKRIPASVLQRAFAFVLFLAAYRLSGLGRSEVSSGFFEYANLGAVELLVLPIFGLVVGGISALVGIGGGMLLIPGLGLLFADLSPLSCRATSLFVVLPTALIGFRRHVQHGTAVPRLVKILAPACAVGAVGGSYLVQNVVADWFPKAFAIFLALAGIRLLLTKPKEHR